MAQWKEHGTCVRMTWAQILLCTSQLFDLGQSIHWNLNVLICNMGLIFPSSKGACRVQWDDTSLLGQCMSQEMGPEMTALWPPKVSATSHPLYKSEENLQLQWSSTYGHSRWVYDLPSTTPHYLETNSRINIFIFLYSCVCLKFCIIKNDKVGMAGNNLHNVPGTQQDSHPTPGWGRTSQTKQ